MTIREEILTIANQLANQGKKPSVALIKTKLSAPAPLPVIISTLKNWQHDPKYTSLAVQQEVTAKKSEVAATPLNEDIQRVIEEKVRQAIKEELDPMRTELAEVKALVQTLTHQKK